MTKNELKRDILILVGRLYNEDPCTFAPETAEVMDRWKPHFKEMVENTPELEVVTKHCKHGIPYTECYDLECCSRSY